MTSSIIYYTDNRLPEPIFSVAQRYIKASNLPITSVSLKPINFGKNIVLNLKPGVIAMWEQIACALDTAKSDYVFFCEHDVLYPKSHFDFIPSRDDIFFYNANIFRWMLKSNKAISYDRLLCLSGMCTNRELALDHYKKRLEAVYKKGFTDNTKDPSWARKWGYEPGTKKIRRGGFSDDDFETWLSLEPIIDVRHKGTFSPPKVTLESFIHQPTNWKETPIDEIPGWDLKEIFNL